MMRRIGYPLRCRTGRDGFQEQRSGEERRREPHHIRRIHTKECSADDP